MIKLLKLSLWIIGVLIILLVAATLVIPSVIDLNQFKGQISDAVQKKTGRQLVIQGNIEHSLFPWIGLKVNGLILSNSASFTNNEPFLRVGHADIQVQLLPLFSKKIEIETLTLNDVHLNLVKNQRGQSNWEDLSNESNAQNADKKTPAVKQDSQFWTSDSSVKQHHSTPLIKVAGINVNNANVEYRDEQTGQSISLSQMMLKSRGFSTGEPFPFSLSLDLNSQNPKVRGHFTLDGDVSLNIKQGIYELKKMRFIATLNDSKAAPVQLFVDQAMLDINQGTFTLPQASLTRGDLNLQLNIQGQNIHNNPSFSGHVQIAPFNFKDLLTAWGQPTDFADPNVLRHVSGSTDFQATPKLININHFNLMVDDSALEGNIQIQNPTQNSNKVIRFNLAMNQINLDRYMPIHVKTQQPVNRTQVTDSTVSPDKNADADPMKKWREMTIDGDVRITSSTLSKTLFNQVYAKVSLAEGIAQINPLNAEVFQGKTSTKIKLDLRHKIPVIALDESLTGVQLSQLTKSDRMTGNADVQANVTFQGSNQKALLESLNGTMRFSINDGVLQGVNIPYVLDRIWSAIKKQPAPSKPTMDQTEFGTFKGSGVFVNGVFKNDDLLVQSSQFKLTGSGTADLVTKALNYRLQAVGMQTVTDAQGQSVSQERQTAIPLLVTGTFSKPIVTPDPQAMANLLLKEKVETLKEKLNTQTAPIREKAREFLLLHRFKELSHEPR